jgi:hypothetical protein
MSGTLSFNTERARDEPELLDVTLFEGGPKHSTKCPFCLKKGLLLEDGTDSVEHILITCPSTTEQRNHRRDTITYKLRGLASAPELDAIADSALNHPDAHAGSASLQTRDLVRQCLKQNKNWEYKTGSIQGILLAATLGLFDERTELIKGAMPITDPDNTQITDNDSDVEGNPPVPPTQPRQNNTGNLTGTHDVNAFRAKLHKLKNLTQHTPKRAAKRAAKKNSTPAKNPPKRPAPSKPTEDSTGNPTPISNNPPQRKRTQEESTIKAKKKPRNFIIITWTPARPWELEKLYRTVRLQDMDVLPDGNCFLYAAMMGIDGRGANHAQAAADLGSRAIAHARSLPETVQDFLDLRRATVDPADPYGNNGTTWSMSHQEGDKRWINSNMFYSIATILRTHIAIATHLQTGIQVCQVLQIHRAGPDPTIPHPANLMPPIAKCNWAPQPPAGERRLSKDSLIITLLDRPRQTGTEQIPTLVIHSDIGSHFRATKPLALDEQPPTT